MKFGPVAPDDAVGGVTVHAIRQGGLVLKKGTVIGAAEVAALKQAGVSEIVIRRFPGKFPVAATEFPVSANFIPVNLSREMNEISLQHNGFLPTAL